MKIQFSNACEQIIKDSDVYSKEPATRVNLTLLQPGGFVQGLAGAKHRFRSTAEGEEMAVEFFAEPTQDAVAINSYISNAKLALRNG